jgi:hypothetical protein
LTRSNWNVPFELTAKAVNGLAKVSLLSGRR